MQKELVKELMKDDGSAAKAHLAAGRAIYYRKRDTPGDLVIKEYPCGRRELIRVNESGEEEVVRTLA